MSGYLELIRLKITLLRPDLVKVLDLKSERSLLFSNELYTTARVSIQQGNFDVESGVEEDGTFREYLDILTFSSVDGIKYVVTVYDTDELWQNPAIIDIFQLG